MERIPTAEERFRKFFNSFPRYGTYLAENWKKEILEIADELAKDKAKFYVKAALKAANKNALVEFSKDWIRKQDTIHPGDLVSSITVRVNEDSILNAYPENLIQ